MFLRKLADNGMLTKIQKELISKSYQDRSSLISNTLTIAAFGAILFVVIEIASGMFQLTSPIFNILSYGSLLTCIIIAVIYFFIKKVKGNDR